MRIERSMWVGITVFAAAIATIYAISAREPAGFTLLLGAVGFGALLAGWTTAWHRRHGDRPSDDTEGDVHAAVETVGVFTVASLRPLVLGAGLTAIVLGLVVGIWMTLIGAAIVASQVALLVRDIDS